MQLKDAKARNPIDTKSTNSSVSLSASVSVPDTEPFKAVIAEHSQKLQTTMKEVALLGEMLKTHQQYMDTFKTKTNEEALQNRRLLAEPPKPQRAVKRPAPKRENNQQFTKSSKRNEGETIKEVPKKPIELKPTLEKSSSKGFYELNKLMTKMVDTELDDIIPKVHEVFTEAISEADFFRTIRSKVCDDLRNVLGLNITKRLLNVHNPLYVKIQFHGKPEKEDLREFLKKYHFTAFARKAVNIFAARLRSIEDFDNLCSSDNVQCGTIKMTVSPVYRFTSCPPNLITKYKDIVLKEERSEDLHKDIIIEETQAVKESKKKTSTTTNSSPIKAETSKPTQVNEKTVNINTTEFKPSDPKSTTDNTTSQNTVNTKTNESKTTPQKSTIENIKSQSTTTTIESKTTPQKQIIEKKISQPTVNTATIESKATPQKSTIAKTTSQPSVNTTVESKTIPQKVVTKAPIAQQQKFTKSITPNKSKSFVSKYSTKSLTTKTSNTVENDYDELDDHDILALMSGGIVLDECSGSDED